METKLKKQEQFENDVDKRLIELIYQSRVEEEAIDRFLNFNLPRVAMNSESSLGD